MIFCIDSWDAQASIGVSEKDDQKSVFSRLEGELVERVCAAATNSDTLFVQPWNLIWLYVSFGVVA
jgi:hypothetical protein